MSTNDSSILTKKYRLVLSAVHMVYRLVNSTYNVRELSLRLARLLCQFIHATSASIFIIDPEKKKIVLISQFDNKINSVIEKKKDLANIPLKEKKVAGGESIFEKHIIGVPLVTDDIVGAIFIRRKGREKPFSEFDREMLSVFAEQTVTAIKNLQLYEDQQAVILGSIKFIGKMVEKQGHLASMHTPVYSKVVKCLAEKLHMSQMGIDCLQ